MSGRAYIDGSCLVPGCPNPKATSLGVCVECWTALPPGDQREWRRAWLADGRVKEWTAARQRCLDYLMKRAR